MDFRDPSYLAAGSARQRHAHSAVLKLGLDDVDAFEQWAACGTIPIGIDLPSSDLDICAWARSLARAREALTARLSKMSGFEAREKVIDGVRSLVARCEVDGLPVEIFAQERPIVEQPGFRHLLIEHRLLMLLGPTFECTIRGLREDGHKTEPAFATALALPGDPYEALLDLESLSDNELMSRWADVPQGSRAPSAGRST